eukprot:2089374-Rhodomonas_salina.2
MPGTDVAHGATLPAYARAMRCPGISLRDPYALSGPDTVLYSAMFGTDVACMVIRAHYVMYGTDIAYGATSGSERAWDPPGSFAGTHDRRRHRRHAAQVAADTPRNQIQETAFLVQFVLEMWLLAFDSVVCFPSGLLGRTWAVCCYARAKWCPVLT